MNSTTKKRIALISVHGDPAIEIGKEEAGGQNLYVRQVGEVLSQLGWHVDMFSRRVSTDQETIVQHNPLCRTIRLTSGPVQFVPQDNGFKYLPAFVEQLLKFQKENGIKKYDLIHTNSWLSSWVGMQLKQIQGSKHVHVYHSLGVDKYNNKDNIPLISTKHLVVEEEVLETVVRILNYLYYNQFHSSITQIEKKLDVGKEIETINKNPSLKARVIGALKAGSMEAVKELVDNPLVNILVAALEGWQKPD